MDDSYQRKHGEVPTHAPIWRRAWDESGKEFTDIIYKKAEYEDIAKVCDIELLLKSASFISNVIQA